MEDKYPIEKNLLIMLSLCPDGLTFTDIMTKVNSNPKIFGNWEQFLEISIFQLKSPKE